MIGFGEYLIEGRVSKVTKPKKEKKPNYNEIMGRVYERATALGVHEGTGAIKNKDKEYLSKIEDLRRKQAEDITKLPPDIRESALKSASNSVAAYLKSLQTNHGVNLDDISEVHHTSKGIGDLIGRDVSQKDNPHDIVVRVGKGKNSYFHGASLKKTQGTLGNNLRGPFSAHGKGTGIGSDVNDIWESGLQKAKLKGKTKDEIQAVQNNDNIKKIYKETQSQVVKHHTDSFNAASADQQREHLLYLMKLNHDKEVPYDYVNGEKGTATPVQDMEHSKAVRNSSRFAAVAKGTTTHIYDDQGRHVLTVEHRATHGPFVSMQANPKLGNLQVPKGEPVKVSEKPAGHPLANPEAAASAASVNPNRVKKLLSQVRGARQSFAQSMGRVSSSPSPIESMPRPGIRGQRVSRNGWPEHMHQAHKDNTIGGHTDLSQ